MKILQLLPLLRLALAACLIVNPSVGSTGSPPPSDASPTIVEPPPRAAAFAKPTVVSRTAWGCPDGQNSPNWAVALTTVTHMIVHHSDGSNSATNWPAEVRSIWNDHKNIRGWGDIGYNYLIDPNGVIYEGRAGGDNVEGGHFSCMNPGTMGVCLMGTFTAVSPTSAALNSLKQLLAWKADQRGLNPTATTYHATSLQSMPVISGHRHANGSTSPHKCSSTECPGTTLFNLLATIRTDVATLIAPATTAQKATNPTHAHGSATRPISGTPLTWTNGSGTASINVYFGTRATPGTAEYVGNFTTASYTPPTLAYSTTYFWRVDSVSSSGAVTTGDVWNFTTVAQTATPTRVIALSGSLGFGNVATGATAQRTLTISNTGNSTLTVSSVSYPTGFSGNWSGGTIASGTSREVTVTFAPTAVTAYSGNVSVASDATSGTATLALSGAGVSAASGPILALDVNTINLPATGGWATFKVRNNGTGSLNYTIVSQGALFNGFSGSGTLNTPGIDGDHQFSYTENTTPIPRTGTITVTASGVTGSPQTITVTQAGAVSVVLTPATNTNVSASGATGQSVGVTAGGAWTAASNNGFLTVTSSATGSGNGTVTYNVAANTDTQPRTGTLTIGGQTHTVSQLGAAALALSPTTNSNLSANGVTGQLITITAPAGLGWTATSDVDWVTFTGSATGTGNGSLTYSVAANSGTQTRTGTITVGGQTHTISQLANSSQVLFADDVESGANSWTPQGTWSITTTSAHSPTRSWTDSPGGNYQNNQNNSLLRTVNLAGATRVTLSFWHRYELAAGDSATIFAHTPERGYVELKRFTGSHAAWRQDYVSLDSFAGATIGLFFQLWSDGNETADGWFIDDFRITPDAAPLPEIDVQGNGRSIAANQSVAPTTLDGRDFGATAINGSGVLRTFTILNTGLATLNLTDPGRMVYSTSSEFAVVTQPARSAIPAGGQVTFEVRFTPGSAGLRTAVLTIPNDDGDEALYSFAVQGTGSQTAPVIERQPASATIEPGRTATLSVVASGVGNAYQWYEGTASNTASPVGSNSDQFTTPALTASKSYWVRVSNGGGAVDSATAQVTVSAVLRAPEITRQPGNLSAFAGSSVSFTVVATGDDLRYQWRKYPGTPIAGATSATLTLNNVQAADAGWYQVEVANNGGTVLSELATLEMVASNPPRISNLAIRANAGSGSATLIVGLAISGTTNKPVFLRAVGPGLGVFGVGGVLADPSMGIYSGATLVSSNDNWSSDAQTLAATTQVGAFALASGSRDAALYLPSLSSGTYTVQITGAGGSSGTVLAEIYDASPGTAITPSTPRLVNVSARTHVGTGNDILIAGFVVAGNGPRTVLIRAIGPTLASFGVGGALTDPQVTLFSGTTPIRTNDNWGGDATLGTAFSQVGAFALPGSARDAALLATLSPGQYSVHVSGVGGATGIALIEVYEVQ